MPDTTPLGPAADEACRLDRTVRPLDLDAIRFLASGQDDPQSMALRECAAEIWALRRWKSTNAPRLEALQGLLTAAQSEAHAGREAITSLASERAANAMLTDEVERLRRVADAARVYYHGYMQDEADDDMGWVCDRDQHELAAELRDALATLKSGPNAKLTGPSENQGSPDEHH